MKKSTFEQIGGTYHQESGYFLPDLFPPESVPIDIWGQRRKYYLKTKREPIYTASLLSGKLESHLSEVDAQAETMFFQLVKAEDQMEWVRQMNSVRNRAEEVIYNELIHA